MTKVSLLATGVLIAALLVPTVASAQRPLRVDPDHFKVDKNRTKVDPKRLPRPSHRSLVVHPRRLAVNQKGGRRQIRVLSHKQRHEVRKGVRGVAHHATTPHHPKHK